MTNPQDPLSFGSEGSADASLFGLPVPDPAHADQARDVVEIAVTEFLDELRLGRRPAIEVYARRYPQHAQRIREVLPLVAAMESWKSNHEFSGARRALTGAQPFERLGDCRIVREIGRGGMGIVYEAVQEPAGRPVAVKVLPGRFPTASQWRKRFEAEALVTERLRHPHIIPVYGYGEHEEWCYFIMHLVEGLPLDRVIDLLARPEGAVYADDIRRLFAQEMGVIRDDASDDSGDNRPHQPAPNAAEVDAADPTRVLRRDSWWQIARIGMQVADALRYAHSRGTLHRDIKPANLLLDRHGSVWVADFGIALPKNALVRGGTDSFGGTPAYMAPEQFQGIVNEQSDVYSLGVTLFELATLQPAYSATSREELLELVRTSVPQRPRALNRQIPAEFERIILKAMARDPERRFKSASELLDDLKQFIQTKGASSLPGRWLDSFGRILPFGRE
ncbi:MAG: serine/threonine protein kinase [Planctomycetaceae bacterium]|nr:serine/threonine protein kinase [Planctomycetaceae bacterium]